MIPREIRLLAIFAFLFLLVSLGLARMVFRSERGMGVSQWLFVGLVWFLMMAVAYVWVYYRLPLPF